MRRENRLLVVGTTSDYIDYIRRTFPQRALFITDPGIRKTARESAPTPREEILSDLADTVHVRAAVTRHLERWGMRVDGVACFDCESLALSALLAENFSVPFPSPSAVSNCRDKLVSKILWERNRIRCPRVAPVRQAEDAAGFLSTLKGDCVLKPLCGSGSELVFRCGTDGECRRAFSLIQDGLKQRGDHRLYRNLGPDTISVIAEEFVDGPEFSCDFLLEEGEITLIRVAQKLPSPNGPFGTIMGYVLVDTLPQGADLNGLRRFLARGAAVLGIGRSICMADFLVQNGEIVLLELTPRPGGDCLPALIRNALGLDMLALALDLAQNRPLHLGPLRLLKPHVGLRIHARQGGIFRGIDWTQVEGNSGIKEVGTVRHPGDRIRMPPEDYESFLVANVIFAPENGTDPAAECSRLLERLSVEMDSP